MIQRDVVITGIGLVSSLGEGPEPHLGALDGEVRPHAISRDDGPYCVHPLPQLELDRQIPKKSDQRQMEAWQRIGVYAAGLALDDAGLKGDTDRLASLDVLVAAGGGERDYAVDGQILSDLPKSANPDVLLNERLMGDLRPTLFLAQLSNLLAGNIAIVHGITGPSRTFMGEEQAGVDALRIAHARIAAGQADTILVGASFNAERPDVLLIYEMGGCLWHGPYAPVFERPSDHGGFMPGSGGAFLVLEAREKAEERGARIRATLNAVASKRTDRKGESVDKTIGKMWTETGAGRSCLVLSGATGVKDVTNTEREALDATVVMGSVHATGDMVGHMMEAQFPFGVALAALAIEREGYEEAVVTSVGHQRGEGLARLSKAA